MKKNLDLVLQAFIVVAVMAGLIILIPLLMRWLNLLLIK